MVCSTQNRTFPEDTAQLLSPPTSSLMANSVTQMCSSTGETICYIKLVHYFLFSQWIHSLFWISWGEILLLLALGVQIQSLNWSSSCVADRRTRSNSIWQIPSVLNLGSTTWFLRMFIPNGFVGWKWTLLGQWIWEWNNSKWVFLDQQS